MYVPSKTWLPIAGPTIARGFGAGVRMSTYRRTQPRPGLIGLGDTAVYAIDPATGLPVAAPYAQPAPTPLVPCLAGSGPLAPGQTFCDGSAPAAAPSTCFTFAFPWFGVSYGPGSCVQTSAPPAPWGSVITFGLLGVIVLSFLKGSR